MNDWKLKFNLNNPGMSMQTIQVKDVSGICIFLVLYSQVPKQDHKCSLKFGGSNPKSPLTPVTNWSKVGSPMDYCFCVNHNKPLWPLLLTRQLLQLTCLSWVSELTCTSQISQWNVLFWSPVGDSDGSTNLALIPVLGKDLMAPSPLLACSIVLCLVPEQI